MKNLKDQSQEPTFYLYCLNTNCPISLYHHPMEIEVPFDAENLLFEHACKCCAQTLVSSMDIQIRGLIAETRCSTSRIAITINIGNLN